MNVFPVSIQVSFTGERNFTASNIAWKRSFLIVNESNVILHHYFSCKRFRTQLTCDQLFFQMMRLNVICERDFPSINSAASFDFTLVTNTRIAALQMGQ